MNYPLLSEYQEAVMSAEDNFAELSHLRPVLDTNGEAVMTSGNFAVVFKMRDEQSGRHYAVKCFLKEQEGRAEAYRQISDELEYVSSSFLTTIKYLDRELFVDSKATDETEFPVVLMDWVEGVTLDKYIRSHLSDSYSLSLLSYQFSRLAMWLLPQPFAHGDLKPDNILVKDDGTLVLVDYDGMYVPAMKGQTPRETGSPDFRHPDRREEAFDEHIDDFSLISILLSIKLIATDSSLLEKHGAADRLLFSEKDYQNISECDMLHSLFPSEDMEQNRLYSIFLMCLADRHIPVVLYKSFNINRPDLRDCNDISQLRRMALRGDSDSQYKLGKCYVDGEGVVQDYAEAVKWYRKSAEQGNAHGQNALGWCYYNGKGVVQDYAEAVKWYRKSVEQGNAAAQFNLGVCYRNGLGVVQDYAEAVKWFSKSAEQGYAAAQFGLGVCYANGEGVVQDYAEAVKWFSKSAEQGDADAQFNLGWCYENGRGVVQDYAEAVKWYRKSAEQGDAVAQCNLGWCYANGRGVVQDYAEAVNWYRKSAEQGNERAKKNLADIESKQQQEEFIFTALGVAFKMIRVDGGTFKMGATPEQGDDANDGEKPVHDVTLSSYYIAETQVTQELWQTVMGSNPSDFTGNLQRPVERVSWHDCQDFIKKLNQLTGKTFRLPTEAEWEYAARGGNKSRGYQYAGSNSLYDVGWYDCNSGGTTHPVKQKQANELGLYDMSGNVWEWCQDWFGDYSSSPQTNPSGPSDGDSRVLRGGSWIDFFWSCRVSCRNDCNPGHRFISCGLRLVLPVNNI